jgi:nucleoside-diphosphate-sugar epimerase
VQAYNIGNESEEISMLELARKCAVSAGRSVESVMWNPEAKASGLQRCAPCVDSVRALALGDSSYIGLDQGLQTMVEWHNFLSWPTT